MPRLSWEAQLGAALVLASAILYLAHYAVFGDLHHIGVFALGDLAFLPVEVLLVTLVIHRVLSEREKQVRMERLNLLIGLFFSEAGTLLLRYFAHLDPRAGELKGRLGLGEGWTDEDLARAGGALERHGFAVEIHRAELGDLRTFLLDKRRFLSRILANPDLLEHEAFTEVLQAVFHLTEELAAREDLDELPPSDLAHIAGDLREAYSLLARQWVAYLRHLREEHPSQFSLAVRTNPFDPEASAVVRG